MDTVDQKTRSEIMARVGQKNTGVEMILRRALHHAGLRYKLHDRSLPGSPDLVFPRFHAVIFVHGCFWHSHGCHRSTVPKSRRDFWKSKFDANRTRDDLKRQELLERGWRVLTVWECSLRGRTAREPEKVAGDVERWLLSRSISSEVS